MPRFDESLIHLLAGQTTDTPRPTSLADLFDEAVCLVVDYVCGGDNRSGRICVQDSGQFPTWVSIVTFTSDGSTEVKYYTRTNDGDEFTAPSLSVSDADPGIVHEAAATYLTDKFAGKENIVVRVFRDERSRMEPTLEATSADPAFREQPEFPSL